MNPELLRYILTRFGGQAGAAFPQQPQPGPPAPMQPPMPQLQPFQHPSFTPGAQPGPVGVPTQQAQPMGQAAAHVPEQAPAYGLHNTSPDPRRRKPSTALNYALGQ